MNIKLLTILFIGLISSFISEVKSEKNLCEFSNPKEYSRCSKKKNKKLVPIYPLETMPKGQIEWMWLGNATHDELINKPSYTIIKFKTIDGENLEVIQSTNKYSTWHGLDWRFKDTVSSYINGDDIISWRINFLYEFTFMGIKSDRHSFEIKYIDNFGNKETLRGRTLQYKGRTAMLEFLFKNASGLSNNAKRDVTILIDNKLRKNEKKATIISSIIKTGSSKNKSCFLAQDTKYPDLVNEYNNIYKTINPLRSKLDLPPSSDLKSICN